MKKYKIEFYSPLLNKQIVKVVDNSQDYKNAIILEVIEEEPQIDLAKELYDFLTRQNKIAVAIYGGASNENNK